MSVANQTELADALGGNETMLRALFEEIVPIVTARSARVLARFRWRARAAGYELADLVQESLTRLFARDARALRQWNAEHGMSFRNWIGLVAEHTSISLLRGASIGPDELVEASSVEQSMSHDPLPSLESRSELAYLSARLKETLTQRSLVLFNRLCVEHEDIAAAAHSFGVSEMALYASRARMKRLAKRVLETARSAEEAHLPSKLQTDRARD